MRKYEYCLYTWGGFFNEQYWKEHKQTSGCNYFESKKSRDEYKRLLKGAEKELDARYLMTSEWEGFDCRVSVILHRTMIINDHEITTHHDMVPVRGFNEALYHMKNKWYPGFNDEPVGDDFDYSGAKVIREWITGPFDTYEVEVK